MADQRDGGIVWTNHTWNPIRGCTKVSEGCRNCYAMHVAARWSDPGGPYEGLAVRTAKGGARWTGKVLQVPAKLADPLRWQRGRLVFVNSMSDLFHPDVPDEYIAAVFGCMAVCPHHVFQVLTKRPERARIWMARASLGQCLLQAARLLAAEVGGAALWEKRAPSAAGRMAWPLTNVWLGTSVEDQASADDRIPDLLATPAAVRFLSCEPLLGAVDLTRVRLRFAAAIGHDGGDAGGIHADALRPIAWPGVAGGPDFTRPALDWVIGGGESGHGDAEARPCLDEWARALRDQCQMAGVPFLWKQWGDWLPASQAPTPPTAPVLTQGGARWFRLGKARAGRMLDGVVHDGMPRATPPALLAQGGGAA